MKTAIDFITNNFKVLVVIVSWIATQYVQTLESRAQIQSLNERMTAAEKNVENYYQKLDAIKLDKVVFEATSVQIKETREDVKEIRGDIKSLIAQKNSK